MSGTEDEEYEVEKILGKRKRQVRVRRPTNLLVVSVITEHVLGRGWVSDKMGGLRQLAEHLGARGESRLANS